jgi:hypothetical protein
MSDPKEISTKFYNRCTNGVFKDYEFCYTMLYPKRPPYAVLSDINVCDTTYDYGMDLCTERRKILYESLSKTKR